jgi:CheY-like chemotaxis protein
MSIRGRLQAQTRILVADQDRLDALTLSAIIHSVGYEVATAFSGDDVLARAANFGPDLLVTEVSLGRLTGMEAAAQIMPELPDCKVLFLSAEPKVSDFANGGPRGLVYTFKSKPFNPLDLLNTIAEILSTNRAAVDATAMVAFQGELEPQLAKMPADGTGFGVRESEFAADRAI